MKKIFALAIICFSGIAFGQTHDFEFEDGRNAHLVPTKEQKDKLQCSSGALYKSVTNQGTKYTVTCSDNQYSYTYIKDIGLPSGGGGGGTHVPTPADPGNSPVN